MIGGNGFEGGLSDSDSESLSDDVSVLFLLALIGDFVSVAGFEEVLFSVSLGFSSSESLLLEDDSDFFSHFLYNCNFCSRLRIFIRVAVR